MRLGTIIEDDHQIVVAVDGDRVLPLERGRSMQELIAAWDPAKVTARDAGGTVASTQWAPAIPEPGTIYTIGANYRASAEPDAARPERPMVLGKLPSSVVGHGATIGWDRALAANVDGECELGVVVGPGASVFGYTIVNDVNSVDPWFDGEHWLLGKSMPGFCPVGPWIVTADELDPRDLRLGCTINGEPIQDGRTSQMRFSIPEIVAYIDRHVRLMPGDLIATGTPPRLTSGPGPDRHLQPGDLVTCWIAGIGELTITIS